MTKKRLREIRNMVDLARRMTDEAMRPGSADEIVTMTAAFQATLALDVVPELLDEIERITTPLADHPWERDRTWISPEHPERGTFCGAPGCGLGEDRHPKSEEGSAG